LLKRIHDHKAPSRLQHAGELGKPTRRTFGGSS
jgi:hypothetical protein